MTATAESSEKGGPTGRALGPRARATRRKLLDATARLLGEQSSRDLRVVDIARAVGTSPATFYQYFRDVEDAVLVLAQEASEQMPAIVSMLEGDWAGRDGLALARATVDAFIRHWDEHQAVLRVRNLASDEGDSRFMSVRQQAMSPVLAAIARRVGEAQETGALHAQLNPHAVAAAMASILERLAAYHTELESLGVTREQLVETSARILHREMTGLDAD
jgi:AcrR family transcriptional regulator